jgi:hypothetical protein
MNTKSPTEPLFLDWYESADGRRIWCWKNLKTDESSQEFTSEDVALEAWRRDELRWFRLEELGD